MTGRKGNNNQRNFGGGKKGGMQHQNRNRMSGGKGGFGGLINQVNPWLSQSSGLGNSFNPMGRSMVSDPQAQLALASNLLNNLLSPASHMNKLGQVRFLQYCILVNLEFWSYTHSSNIGYA